ncbi:MAG: hypothetical protein AAF761_10540 [Pseudomonadota bacterium]
MNTTQTTPLTHVMAAAIADHGALKVLGAAVLATFRPGHVRLNPDVPEYLRHDVGLQDTAQEVPARLKALPEILR